MRQRVEKLARQLIPISVLKFAKKWLMRWKYRGNRYQCPTCQSRLRTFLPGGAKLPFFDQHEVSGGGYREQMFCPVCDSTDRERLLYLILQQNRELRSRSQRLLHVSPERRIRTMLSSYPRLKYLTADLQAKHVQVNLSLTDLPLPDESFDALICNHVLEHVPDDHMAMAELYRVLKPGGWAILQVPLAVDLEHTYEDLSITDKREREAAFGQYDHVRIYGRDYRDRLEAVGFKVEVFEWATKVDVFGGADNLYGLHPGESVYTASK